MPEMPMPRDNSVKGGKRARTPMKTLMRLLGYAFSGYRAATAFVVIFVLLASVTSVTGTLFIAEIVEMLLLEGTTFSDVLPVIITVACVYVVGGLSNFAYTRIMMYIAQGTLKRMRNDMFRNMQRLPLRYFDAHTHGEVMSLYTNDVDTMRQLLSQTIPQLLSALIMLVAVLCFMMYYSVTLSLVVFAIIAVMVIVISKIGGRSAREFTNQQKSLGRLNGFVEEMTDGQKVVKVFCHEDKAREGFEAVNDELNEASRKANSYSFILGPINNNLGWLQYVLVAVIGFVIITLTGGSPVALLSLRVRSSAENQLAASAGMLVAMLMCARLLNNPVQQVSQQFNSIVMALAGAERIFDLIDTVHEDAGGDITLTRGEAGNGGWAWKKASADGTTEYVPLEGDIRFNDVVFGYEEGNVILKDISLYAKPRQKIALVGSTGAGKTTIVNLINRFYDIQSGSITFDGIDIRDINKDDLRRSLGIVLQDTHLFTGTVMDNIRYGRLDATDEECVAAARLANADSFVRHLPDGYDTVLSGDGANLSQGQRQLLAIARAMVSDCPVLILDEATSSVDTRTEKLIEEGMDKLMEGRTVFVIAHRLSTVRNSHAILVIEHGEIIERGNHEQLIEQRGRYYQLYTGAFELD